MTRVREDQMGLLRQALAELGEPSDWKFAAISQRNLAQLLAGQDTLLALQSIVVRYRASPTASIYGAWVEIIATLEAAGYEAFATREENEDAQ